MGQEIVCLTRFAGKEEDAKALLEGSFLVVGSDFRLKIPFEQIKSVTAGEDGWLSVETEKGLLELRLGEETAAKWEMKILANRAN